MKTNGHHRPGRNSPTTTTRVDHPADGPGRAEQDRPARRSLGSSASHLNRRGEAATKARTTTDAAETRRASLVEQTRLSRMIEDAPTSMMYCDRDPVIRYLNPASARLLKRIESDWPCPCSSPRRQPRPRRTPRR